jgi:hypothetical protein
VVRSQFVERTVIAAGEMVLCLLAANDPPLPLEPGVRPDVRQADSRQRAEHVQRVVDPARHLTHPPRRHFNIFNLGGKRIKRFQNGDNIHVKKAKKLTSDQDGWKNDDWTFDLVYRNAKVVFHVSKTMVSFFPRTEKGSNSKLNLKLHK